MNQRTLITVVAASGLCVLALLAYVLLARGGAFLLEPDEVRARHATADSQFIQVLGLDLHYHDQGGGPVIVLLHANFGSLFTWDEVARDLVADYRVIRLDAAGTGLSGMIPTGTSARGVKPEDVLEALLDALGVDTALMVGASGGGVDAYRFAATRPDRVRGLVLSNTPAGMVDNEALQNPIDLRWYTWVRARLGGYAPRGYWGAFLRWTFYDPQLVSRSMIRQHHDLNRRVRDPNAPLRPWARSMDEVTPFLEGVTVRTRLLWPDSSPVLPLTASDWMLESLPNANVDRRVLPGTGHFPYLEAPAAYAAELRAFDLELASTLD